MPRTRAHSPVHLAPGTLRRLLVTMSALVVLLAPASAWALAPMCDEDAQTIEAPAPIFPIKDRVVRAGMVCDGVADSGLGTAPARDPGRPVLTADAIDRGLGAATKIPPCARSARLVLIGDPTGSERPGSRLGVFRPPRG